MLEESMAHQQTKLALGKQMMWFSFGKVKLTLLQREANLPWNFIYFYGYRFMASSQVNNACHVWRTRLPQLPSCANNARSSIVLRSFFLSPSRWCKVFSFSPLFIFMGFGGERVCDRLTKMPKTEHVSPYPERGLIWKILFLCLYFGCAKNRGPEGGRKHFTSDG